MFHQEASVETIKSTILILSHPLKLEKGVKRKADTTISGTTYEYSNSTSAEFKSRPMRSKNNGWDPYYQNNMASMVLNAAITPQQASHKSQEKMDNREYRTHQEFGDDLKLMFKNRYRYNQPEHDVFVLAKKLETIFDTRYAKIPIEHSVKVVRSSSTKSDSSISGSYQNHPMTLEILKKNAIIRS